MVQLSSSHWLTQMLVCVVLWSGSVLVLAEQSDQEQRDGDGSSEGYGLWQNTTDVYESTTGYNITADDTHKRFTYALTFKITLALCLVSILIVTTVLVAMVLYAKYKGWKSRSATSSLPVMRTGEQSRPAPFPLSPSFAKNPMDPSIS